MSEQETLESKVEETQNSSQPAPAEEKNTEDSKQEGEPVVQETKETPGIDYKAELAEAQSRLKRAEEKIVKLKKDSPSKEKKEEGIDEDRVAQIVAEQVGAIKDQVRSEIVESEVDDMLSEISSNPDERQLIKHIYENNLRITGHTRADIREGLLNAKILANKQTLIKSNAELAEALTSKATIQTSRSISSASRPSVQEEPQHSQQDQKIFSRMKALNMNK